MQMTTGTHPFPQKTRWFSYKENWWTPGLWPAFLLGFVDGVRVSTYFSTAGFLTNLRRFSVTGK